MHPEGFIRNLTSDEESADRDVLSAAAVISDDGIRFLLHSFSRQPWCCWIWKLNIDISSHCHSCSLAWRDGWASLFHHLGRQKQSRFSSHRFPTVTWESLHDWSICGNFLSLLAIPVCYSVAEFCTHEAVTNIWILRLSAFDTQTGGVIDTHYTETVIWKISACTEWQ